MRLVRELFRLGLSRENGMLEYVFLHTTDSKNT